MLVGWCCLLVFWYVRGSLFVAPCSSGAVSLSSSLRSPSYPLVIGGRCVGWSGVLIPLVGVGVVGVHLVGAFRFLLFMLCWSVFVLLVGLVSGASGDRCCLSPAPPCATPPLVSGAYMSSLGVSCPLSRSYSVFPVFLFLLLWSFVI